MADETQSTFQEVFGVDVDSDGFAKGLARLTAEYKKWLNDVGTEADKILGSGSLLNIQNIVQALSEAFAEVVSVVHDVDAKFDESRGKQDAASEAAAQKERERAKATADFKIAQENRFSEALARARVEGIGRPQGPNDDPLQQGQFFVDLAARTSHPNFPNGFVAPEAPARQSVGPLDNTSKDILTKIQAAEQAEEASIQKLNALRHGSAESYTLWWERAVRNRDALETQFQEKQALQQKERISKETLQQQEATAQRIADEERAATAAAERDRKLQFSRVRPGEEVDAAHQKALQEEADGKHDTALQQFAQQTGTLVLRLAEYYAIWKSIELVINSVTAILSSPFVAFKDGAQYLDEVQHTADHLVGTLATNAKFSNDISQNFKIAAEVAKDVAAALRDVSNQTGLSLDHLENVYRSLQTAGVAAVTSNERQVVGLTKLLTLTNEQVKGTANMRGLLAEIPQLLNGTLKQGSAFLEVTKLTAIEAKNLVSHAKDQGDLYERLLPLLSQYLTATEQTALHHEQLVKRLDEEKSRLEAIFATPAYEKINAALKSILDWVEQNRVKLQDWAEIAGKVAATFLDILANIAKVGGSSTFDSVLAGLTLWAIEAAQFLNILIQTSRLLLDLNKLAVSPDKFNAGKELAKDFLDAYNFSKKLADTQDHILDSVSKVNQSLPDRIQEAVVKAASQGASVQQILAIAQQVATGGTTNGLDQGRTGTTPPPSLDPKKRTQPNLKGEYDERIQATKDAFDKELEVVREKEADLEISKRDAAARIAVLDEAEVASIRFRGEEYRKALAAYYAPLINVNPEHPDQEKAKELSDRLAESRKQSEALVSSVEKRTQAANRAGIKEGVEVAKLEAEGIVAVTKKEAEDRIKLWQQMYSEGYITELQFIKLQEDAEEHQFETEKDRLEARIVQAAAGSKQRIELENQLALLQQARLGREDSNGIRTIESTNRANEATRKFLLSLEETASGTEILGVQIKNSLSVFKDTQSEIFDIRDKNLDSQIREIELELDYAKAQGKTGESTRKLTEDLAKLNAERLSSVQGRIQGIQSSSEPQFLKDEEIQSVAKNARNTLIQNQPGQGASQSDILQFNAQIKALDSIIHAAAPSLDNAFKKVEAAVFGFDLKGALDKVKDKVGGASTLDYVAVYAKAAAGALQNLGGVVDQIGEGFKKGGIAGGIGSIGAEIAKFLPGVAGEIVGAVSGILSFFGGLFNKTAAQVAEDIKKSITLIENNFANGAITLQQEILQLEQQRVAAIQELSGKKGGQDELNKLLPGLDQQIAQLQIQQRQTVSAFEQQLAVLETQSDVLGGIQQQWQQIVKSTQDYLSAGGDATNATKFLSAELEKIQKDAQSQLDQGNQQAIQDAIALNGLLQQKVDLEKSYSQQVFDVVNADSIERRQPTRVSQLDQLKQQHDAQLDSLNQQISLATSKVNLEAQVFDLAGDINDLHRQDDAMTLAALQTQLDKYKDLKGVISSIWQQPGGVFTSNNPTLSAVPNIIVNIDGDIVGVSALDATKIGQNIGQGITDTLKDAVLSGLRNGLNP